MNVFDVLREKLEEFKNQLSENEMLSALGVHIVERVVEETQKIVNQVEKEHSDGWILCSERLPDNPREVFYSAKVVEPSECKLIRKPICTNDETMVSLLNQIIEEAIRHGGDSGGPYFCNDIELCEAIQRFIHYIGADNLYKIEWRGRIPKIVLEGGGENAN